MTERVQKTLAFLEECFEGGSWFSKHPEDMRYRLEHSIRVANLCREIAAKEGMDEEAAVIAGLLHDIAYGVMDTSEGYDWKNHGRDGARIARPFLESLGLDRPLRTSAMPSPSMWTIRRISRADASPSRR